MLFPRITCSRWTGRTGRGVGSAAGQHSGHGGKRRWPCSSGAHRNCQQHSTVLARTTMPRSALSFSSTVLSRTMFMNWSKPLSTPVTCRFALSFTAGTAVGHGVLPANAQGPTPLQFTDLRSRQPWWTSVASVQRQRRPGRKATAVAAGSSPLNFLSIMPFSSGGCTFTCAERGIIHRERRLCQRTQPFCGLTIIYR